MPTILHRLSNWASQTPNAPAQSFKTSGRWETISASQFRDRVHFLALFLRSRGVTREDVGAVLSYNCPEWVHAELAMLLLGAKSAGLYPNSTPKDIQYILAHTQAVVLSLQNKEYFEKAVSGQASLPPHVRVLLCFDGDTSVHPNAVSYAQAIAEGEKLSKSGPSYEDLLSKIDPKDGAILIYTSGTTGTPKGALLSHDNLAFTSDVVAKQWGMPFGRGSLFSFLPLCHVAEQLQNVGVGITQRYKVSFATKFENVGTELPETQPTLLLCVPRLWEKMMEGVLTKVRNGKGAKKILAQWALALGARVAEAKYSGRRANPLDLLQLKLADKLVLSKVRQALGLANAEKLASGAAALAPHISKWFRCLGLEILEDFGQTESTGVICMTEPGTESSGTVGKPPQSIEFKLAEDGEILTRGRHVFVGYYKDESATSQTLVEGWLHTGDLGERVEGGLIRIRGRKKEILKTSGGKMVAPMPIEERLKAVDIISQVCIVGDGRKYLAALITLSENVMKEMPAAEGLVIAEHPVLQEIRRHIDELNKSLASFEQIKKFAVLAREFSVIDGEMTPTLKLKRNVIELKYQGVIDQFYC